MKRKTRQGKIITEIIQNADRPLTPFEIHQLAALKVKNLGIATTYRHLKTLSENKRIAGIDYPGQPPRYEWADGKDKMHFACRHCEKLFAFEDTILDLPSINLPQGFEIMGSEVMLYGFCSACVDIVSTQKK